MPTLPRSPFRADSKWPTTLRAAGKRVRVGGGLVSLVIPNGELAAPGYEQKDVHRHTRAMLTAVAPIGLGAAQQGISFPTSDAAKPCRNCAMAWKNVARFALRHG